MQNEIIKLLLYWKSILRLVASESKNCSDRVTLKQNSYSILVTFHEFLGKIMFKRRYLFEFQVSVCPISRVSLLPKDSPKKRVFAHRLTPKTQHNSTQPNPSTSTHHVFRCQRLLSWKEGHVHRWKFTLLLLHTLSTPTMLPLEKHRHVGFCDAHVGPVHQVQHPLKKKRTKL